MSDTTPGPWIVGASVNGHQTVICQPVADGYDPHIHAIAFTVIRNYRPMAEAEANARLMAASPDLLHACKAMLLDYESQYGENYCECDSSVGLTCNACYCRSAIAKSEVVNG